MHRLFVLDSNTSYQDNYAYIFCIRKEYFIPSIIIHKLFALDWNTSYHL